MYDSMYVNNNSQNSKFLNQNLNIDHFIFMYIIYNLLILYLHSFFYFKIFQTSYNKCYDK